MSNEEESLLALLWESLGNGQRSNAPIFINFNSFNAPIGQHNDHVDTVNFSMDKDGGISFHRLISLNQKQIGYVVSICNLS